MVANATILGCEGPALGDAERAFFREADPWGFILFARNVENPDQLRRLTADLRDAVGRDAPVLVDQEGGRVQRMRAPHWHEWLPPLDQVSTLPLADAVRAMEIRARLIADELRAVGIDANCAPTADIASAETHPFLMNRCYGTDADTVATVARSVARGLISGGVLPVMKHLPGHGRARADSHKELPRVTESAEELQRTDFVPFRALADLPMAMTAHIVFEKIDADNPATTSSAMIQVIRDRIGFAGLLMTDDLSMQALCGNLGARAAASISAGCDVVLHCNGKMDEMTQVVTSAGEMSPEARRRADAALAARRAPEPAEPEALWAEFRSLTGSDMSDAAR